MADTKISALPSGAPAQAGDEYVVARSGANYKLTLTNIAATMPPIGASTPNTGAFTTLSASGNLTFSSTAQRITGDMSNATITNRLMVQTSTTNGNTLFSVMPNGTGTAALVRAFNSSTPAQFVDIRIDGTEAQLRSSYEGTSTFLPLTFYTGGSERMRLDTSGNLGIGTSSPTTRLTVSGTTTVNTAADATAGLVVKTFGSAGGTQPIVNFQRSDAAINFQIGYNGNTGDTYLGTTTNHNLLLITNNTTKATLDTSGNLGIGTSTANKSSSSTALTVNTGTAANYSAVEWSSNNTLNYHINANDSAIYHVAAGTRPWIVYTNGSERLRIDSSGNVGIGGTASAFDRVTVTGTLPSSSAFSIGFGSRGTIPSTSTSLGIGFSSVPNTQAASFTLSGLTGFYAGQGTFGAGSTVTNQYGYYAENNLTGATNNYGFYSNIAAASNRWNFYAAGTARNYFAGGVEDSYGNLRKIPQSGSDKTGSYTLATTDVGQFIGVGSGGSITVPDATFATGDVVSVFNNTTGNVTLTMTITTAYIGGTNTDKATITLATRGVATILFISGTVCVVNGNVS